MKVEAEYSPAPQFDAPDPEELNALLAGYEVTALIARGSMGAVYLARQIALQREVAIKVLPRALSRIDEFQKSFVAEARAMAKLPHPHLISVFDFGEVGGMLYIVMEYIEGESLLDAAHGEVIDPVQSVQIVERIAEGLAHAHEHGLLHRDIKPANILISVKLEPKLGDFGLVVPSADAGSGMMMGTPGYIAPEMLQDFNSASPASDVFALGVILHELLTGVEPDAESPVDLDLVPSLRGLRELVQNATAQSVSMRYQDGGAFATDLQLWLAEAEKFPPQFLAGAYRASTASPLGPVHAAQRRPVPLASASGSGPGTLIAIAIGAAIVMIVVFILASGGEREERPKPGGSGMVPPSSNPTDLNLPGPSPPGN